MRTRCLVACLSVALVLAAAGTVRAQDAYPNRVIRFIVGFAAGGGNDLFARLVVNKFQENTGATTIVENKPGAGGRISSDYVAHQPPDGYTVLVAATGQMSIAAAIYPNLSYHPTKSFIPLNMIASFPLVLVVPASSSDQEREGTGGLGEGASRQIELRHLGAALHHRQRTAQAQDRHARRGESRSRAPTSPTSASSASSACSRFPTGRRLSRW